MAFEDTENKVERGAKLRIKASTFNDIQDVVRQYKRNKFELSGQKPTSLIRSNLDVLVYNSIGEDLIQPFQVVKIKQPLIDISEDVLNANTRSTFIATEPEDTFDAIGITQVPIKDGDIDKAVINGITIVKVKFTAVDHTWANPVDGVTDYLESAELGQARILMDLGTASGGLTEAGDELDSGEESGTGSGLIGDIRWCMVNLIGAIFADDGGSGVAGNPFVVNLSEATGLASGQPRTLDGSGNWINDGAGLNNVLVPMQIEGSTVNVNPNATVLTWYSKQSGKYEYLPFQYANGGYPGLVSTGDQTWTGTKTLNGTFIVDTIFVDDLTVNNNLDIVGNETIGGSLEVGSNISGDIIFGETSVHAGETVGVGTGGGMSTRDGDYLYLSSTNGIIVASQTISAPGVFAVEVGGSLNFGATGTCTVVKDGVNKTAHFSGGLFLGLT